MEKNRREIKRKREGLGRRRGGGSRRRWVNGGADIQLGKATL